VLPREKARHEKGRAPQAVAVNASEAVFIADSANHAIRVLVAGVLTTLAGNGLKAMTAGQTYSLTLSASEVLHLEAPAGVDLSGTRVETSRPVAVFAGSASTSWSEPSRVQNPTPDRSTAPQ
jgi:hypothetical protein